VLGKCASEEAELIRRFGWEVVVSKARGESNVSRGVRQLPHKAARLLQHLRRRGAGVLTSTAPWTIQRLDAAVARGSHKSAHLDREFVLEEMMDFCRQGYWMVVPYAAVRHWRDLRLSPIGAVPQRDRRPRLIVDYSFSDVNAETVQLAPPEAMQFGRALHRVLRRIVEADGRYGPVYLAKIDIADGFYRVWLQYRDIPKLGVVLPTSPGQPPLIAFPLTLPMGWVESPPYFTVLTETVCDLANASLRRGHVLDLAKPHHLEHVAATLSNAAQASALPSKRPRSHERLRSSQRLVRLPGRPPVADVDVYVDDFLLLAQTEPQRTKVMRTTLHAIDQVFRPLAPSDPNHRKEPASVKKMLKGDACWDTQKRILGWDIDTEAQTLQLPEHRLDRLHVLLDSISPPHKRVSAKHWHQLLGELRSMSPALPGARGLFSILQESLRKSDRHRVRITKAVWDMAADFRDIARSLQARPTRLRELVPSTPAYVGASDACIRGMGGVWFDTSTANEFSTPMLWRTPFTSAIQAALVTSDNPKGAISISDLELSAMIAHKDVLATYHPVAEQTIWMATDNRAALSWSTKGSATSTAARAYLLRLNSLHQRRHRYVPVHNHIAGKANAMADDASRRWDLSNAELLTHFNLHYPQASPWQLCHLPHATKSTLTGALFSERHRHAFRDNVSQPLTLPGDYGRPSARPSKSILTTSHVTPSHFSNSLPSASATVPLLPAVTPCDLARWKTPYALWARRTPGWGPLTLA
jgi:hypothetical protein